MEFRNNSPIYLQVIEDIKNKIVLGEVELGQKLPSTREIAAYYGINPNTAVRVYNEMENMGLVFTKRGLGTFVTEETKKYSSIKEEMAMEYVKSFFDSMKKLGMDKEEMIKHINEYKE